MPDDSPDSSTDDGVEHPDRGPFGDERPAADPAEVLRAIADEGGPLPYDSLHALSAADDALTAQLLQLWSGLSVERRREVLASFQRVSDNDATLDFSRAHLSALLDPDPATRILAIRGLWEHEREEYLHLLTDLVTDDPEGSVRAEAASALGRFVVSMEFDLLTEDAAERLQEVLRDVIEDVMEEDEVRGRALESIAASSEEWVAELIAEHYDAGSVRLRVASLRAMGRNAADEWLPILIHNFDDEDPDVRAAAAEASGALLLEDAVGPLTELVADDDREVRLAAIGALGEIAGDAAEAVLLDIARGPEPDTAGPAQRALQEARVLTGGDASGLFEEAP